MCVCVCEMQVRRLLCAPSQQKLLLLAGSTLEEGGDLLLQTGCFSPHHLLNICTELQVRSPAGGATTTTTTALQWPLS